MAVCVHTLATHQAPQLDEIFSIWLLWNCREAEQHFQGANDATVVFWGNGRDTPDGREAQAWMAEGVLPIGCGGSLFDEHPQSGRLRIKGECAATLVAKHIGVSDDPRLGHLIEYARVSDLFPAPSADDLAYVIKLAHHNPNYTPQQVFDWVVLAIEAKYEESPPTRDFRPATILELLQHSHPGEAEAWGKMLLAIQAYDQILFHRETADEYRRRANILEFRGRGRQGKIVPMKLVAVETDDPRMHRYVRSEACVIKNADGSVTDNRAMVTIIKRSSGNCAIFGNHSFGVTLKDVARVIKIAEMEADKATAFPRWNELGAEGTHGVWHYATAGEFLLNGSHTAPDVPPTKLSLTEIIQLVKLAVSAEEFEPRHAKQCRKGECGAPNNGCTWHRWGLSRCQTIRFEQRKKAT